MLDPKRSDHLEQAAGAAVGLSSRVPETAFTAGILGSERTGHGVLISGDGIVLTVGYLVMEANEVWLRLADGRVYPGYVLGLDLQSGLGLVQALTRDVLPYTPLGDSDTATAGSEVVVAGHGGNEQVMPATVMGRREFAGYWEYLLDDALFTAPAHPNWGGAGVLDLTGQLLGIASLHVGHRLPEGETLDLNMVIPVNLLKPVLNDIVKSGRPLLPARPWLGLYADDGDDRIAVIDVSMRGPAARAGLRRGDLILAVNDAPVKSLAGLFRAIWALGEAGVVVPLTVQRGSNRLGISVNSIDRYSVLRGPMVH